MKAPRILARDFTPFFALKHMEKDLRLMTEVARELGVKLPQTEALRATYAAALASGWGDRDFCGIFEFLEQSCAPIPVRQRPRRNAAPVRTSPPCSGAVKKLGFDIRMMWPSHLLVEARLPSRRISDEEDVIAARLDSALEHFDWNGRRVALAVGSRGIDRIAQVVRAIVAYVVRRNGIPFIVPAMGSHGGATPEGQAHVLDLLGINEQSVGAPINPSIEAVAVGRTAEGTDVFTSREALNADAVVLVNRIKPHTDFEGAIGSGLLKMAAIGLGKREGAFECHRAAVRLGHEAVIRSVASVALGKLPVACGVGLIEDERHQLARIEVLPASQIAHGEEALFEEARRWVPSLPFAEIDVLVVDEMGKNVSGAGMDPNVIGRGVDGLPRARRRADIGAIYTRSLTPQSGGNAIGLGLADVVSSRLVSAMNGETLIQTPCPRWFRRWCGYRCIFRPTRNACERRFESPPWTIRPWSAC